MSAQFDPYYEWLGIPPRDQPANHYRLLGIEVFEENLNVIERAADRQMGHLRTFQNGQRAADSQRLLNELSAAKVTLLRADKKAAYDDVLREQIQAEIAPAAETVLPLPIAQPVAPAATAAAPAPATASVAADQDAVTVSPRRQRKGRRNGPARLVAFAIPCVIVVAVGLIAAVYTGVFSSKNPPSPSPSGGQPIPGTTKQPIASPATRLVPSSPAQIPSETPTESTTVEQSAPPGTLAKIDESRGGVPEMHPAAIDSSLKRTIPSDWIRSLEAGGGIVTDRFLLCQSMAYDELVTLLRRMATFGCRPLRIRPYSVGGNVRVAAVWTRDGRPWRFVAGVTASEYTAANERLTSAGFEPLDVAGFGDDEVRFAGVWVKSEGATSEAEVWLGRKPSEFRDELESQTDSRLIAHTRHLFVSNNEFRYSVIWKPSPPGTTKADRFGGSRSFFEARLQPGDHLLDISVAPSNESGHVIDAALVRGLPPTTQLYLLTPESHLERSRELARQGLSPTSICVAWQRSGQPVVASVWESPSDGESSPPTKAAGSYALHFDGRTSVVLSDTRGLFDLDKRFTAEVWFRVTRPPAANLTACFGTAAGKALHPDVTGPPLAGWLVAAGRISQTKPGDSVEIRWSDANPRVVAISNTVPALNNDWHHLAICNQPQPIGGWVSDVFVDGMPRMRVQRPASDIHPSPSDFFLGVSEFVSAQTSFYGDMRACRLSNSIRYTSRFTPDETFASDESTLVLLQFDGADPSLIQDVSGANRHGQIHGGTWIRTMTPSEMIPSEMIPSEMIPSEMTTSTPPPRPNPGPLVAEAAPKPRLAVPSAEDRRAASEKVKEIYADDFAKAKEPAAMVALANDLSQQAVQTQEGAAKFGLLFEARQMAIEAVNPRLALRMTDHLTDAFEVKSWTLKADTMTRLSDVAKSATERQVLAELVLDKSEEALQAREFEAADKLNGLITHLNRPRDRDLAKASLSLKARIAEASEAWRQVEKARQQLADSPDDPHAHLTIGRYLCFVAADWDNGLPHLARGEHAALKELATQDLTDPSESQHQLKMADAWYDWGQKASGSDRNGAWLRARHWYDAALPGLADLDLAKANKRLNEIADQVTSKTIRNAKFPWLDVKVGLVKRLEGHTAEVRSLAVAHTGNHIVSGSTDQTVRFWDIAKGEEIALLRPGVGTFARLGLSPDDKFVIVAGASEIVEIWNLQSGKLADRLDTKLRSRAMATARDSNVLLWALSSSRPGNLRLFALRQGQIGQLNCPGSPLSISISDNGRLVAAGSSDGNVYVWRLRPAQTAGPFTGLGSSPSDVALSADGTMVAACVFQQTMVWDINTGNIVSRMPTSASCYRIAFSPDGRRLLTVGQANEISVWNVEDGQMIETLSARNSNFIGVATAVHYLPDPRGAVSAGTDGTIRVWRLPD